MIFFYAPCKYNIGMTTDKQKIGFPDFTQSIIERYIILQYVFCALYVGIPLTGEYCGESVNNKLHNGVPP